MLSDFLPPRIIFCASLKGGKPNWSRLVRGAPLASRKKGKSDEENAIECLEGARPTAFDRAGVAHDPRPKEPLSEQNNAPDCPKGSQGSGCGLDGVGEHMKHHEAPSDSRQLLEQCLNK